MGAGVGLEPHDLRVMSPTSYQLLYPAILDCISSADPRIISHSFLNVNTILGKMPPMVPETGLEPVRGVNLTGF
jgi:hypothetical protein